MKFDRTGETAYLCDTKELSNAFIKECKSKHISVPKNESHWDEYKEHTCYVIIDSTAGYTYTEYARRNGVKVVQYAQMKQKENPKAKALRWVANQIPDIEPKTNEEKMIFVIKKYCIAGAEEIERLEAKLNAMQVDRSNHDEIVRRMQLGQLENVLTSDEIDAYIKNDDSTL